MPLSDVHTSLLRYSACIKPDAEGLEQVARSAAGIVDWDHLIQRAEKHAVAPLMFHHLKQAGASIPKQATDKLRALTIRHRHANRVRSQVLAEIVDAFTRAGIECVVLKGAALAHLIYPSPALRPMRDLDLLVPQDAALRAQQMLAEIGFDAPVVHGTKTMRLHHHMPNATLYREGLNVSVELHRDAVSGDYPDKIQLGKLASPPQEVVVGSQQFKALSHTDMLRHLCLHAFEPAAETRLISSADIIGYANHFIDDIDWEHAERHAPRIINVLALLHYLTPLPAPLGRFRPPSSQSPPQETGRGLVPISEMLAHRQSTRALLGQLLWPPDWWLRGYYGASLTTPLYRIRWCSHVPRLGRWAFRRIRAVLG